MNKKRLLKLADFLEKLEPRKLDMSQICQLKGGYKMDPFKCKSVACAMGWTPAVFPRLVEWDYFSAQPDVFLRDRPHLCDWLAMNALFDLKPWQSNFIFGSGTKYYHEPKQVAEGIREFVETGKIPERMR